MDASEKVSVLLVDDRPEKLLALQAVLGDLPLTLVCANSGREALRRLLAEEFACILLDINMPGMDGFETATLIRQRKISEHTPIIFATACHDEVFMSRGYLLGAVDYILQPVVPEILRSKVLVFVDLYRKSRQVMEQARWQQQRANQLQKLASASVAINAAPSMAGALQCITETARDVIGSHQAITLFRTDRDDAVEPAPRPAPAAEKNKATVQSFSSFSRKYADWRGRPLWLDLAAHSIVATSRTPTRLTARQLPEHGDFELIIKLESEGEIPPVVGLLAAPLIGRDGRNMGVIYLSDKTEGEFSADDEAIILQLSQMAVVAIENHISGEARDANRAKDQFIAVLSHELRTPLTPVLASVATLQTDKRLPPDVQDDLKLIRRNVELEARLIDDLLDLTRISKGKIALQLTVVDVNELLLEAVNISRTDITEKNIELVMDLRARHKFVKGDATRLQQVFWNLIKNAVKFTPEGGRIVVESFDAEGGLICARVIDSGIGVDPEILPRIFNAFEQGRSSITRQFGGLGLGLAISKTLVDQHQGTLQASSEGRGKGSTFTVSIPVTTELPQAAYHTPRVVAASPQRAIRALLAEDHRDTARVMSKLLRGNGYEVDCAASVTEALQLLKANRYDILISDIGLPDGSGVELMQQIRVMQPMPGIALSGFGMEQDIRRSKEAGFAEHLIKPLNFQLLVDAIERLTANAEAGVGAPMVG